MRTVAKPELGTKRLCANCGAKFYDLDKDPIHCPKSGTVHEVVQVVSRSRPEPPPVVAPRPPGAPVEAVPVPEPAAVEAVSLEEADAEAQGEKKPATAEPGAEEEVE